LTSISSTKNQSMLRKKISRNLSLTSLAVQLSDSLKNKSFKVLQTLSLLFRKSQRSTQIDLFSFHELPKTFLFMCSYLLSLNVLVLTVLLLELWKKIMIVWNCFLSFHFDKQNNWLFNLKGFFMRQLSACLTQIRQWRDLWHTQTWRRHKY